MMKLIIISTVFLFSITSCTSIKTERSIELKGMYSYMADVAMFTDCKTDKKYPVAFEGDNVELEKAYLDVRKNAGEQILITLSGHFEMRPKMEGNGEREFLVVDKFDRIWPFVSCTRNLGTASLTNTFWSLREVSNISIKELDFQKYPNFIIKENNKVKGFGGCNNFFGNSLIKKNTITFSNIGATRKMCNKYMDVESKFLKALETVNNYKIYGEFLYLYNNKELLAIFESVYFN